MVTDAIIYATIVVKDKPITFTIYDEPVCV